MSISNVPAVIMRVFRNIKMYNYVVIAFFACGVCIPMLLCGFNCIWNGSAVL